MLVRRLPRFAQLSLRSYSRASYIHAQANVPLLFETLGDNLRKAAEKEPNKEFLVFQSYQLRKTYSQFYTDSRRLAASLLALGLKKGDRVAVSGNNYYEWAVSFYANAMAGFIQVNINPHYKADELRFVLNKVNVKAIITPKKHKRIDFYNTLMEIVPELARGKPGIGTVKCRDVPSLEHVICYGSQELVGGCWSFEELWSNPGSIDFKRLDSAENHVRPDDPVDIQFTSGTTGFPKAAMLTHNNVNNNGYFAGLRAKWDEGEHRLCVPNPLFHAFGCIVGLIGACNHQQTLIVPSIAYDVEKIFQAIQNEKCTFMFGTPTMYVDLTASSMLEKYDVSSLRGGFIGGAPCPQALCEKMVNLLNMKDTMVLYGSTEVSGALTISPLETNTFDRIKNVGTPLPHCEMLVVNEDNVAVPKGERGELWARGFGTMLGYFADEEKTKQDLTADKWFHTGDTAVMNEDGTFSIVGRVKDMIIRGGENIYPTEIEQYIFRIPGIADVQVFGVPDDRYGEVVCAWVRVKDNCTEKVTPESIQEFCKTTMAHYKVPKHIMIKEQKDFPMTPSGKVKKNELKSITKKLLDLEGVKSHFDDEE